MSFNISRGEFIQVLNVGRNHWITISSQGKCSMYNDQFDFNIASLILGCSNMDHVFVYDSLPSGNISSRTKEQIASICFSEKK